MLRVAQLNRNVRQPNHVLADSIAGHQPERRPGADEEWLAATKHDGAQVESILINETKLGQASCQVWSGNVNLPGLLSLQSAYHRLDVIPGPPRSFPTSVALGPTDFNERDTTHFGLLRHSAAKS